jgi:hypothetical protein
MRKAAGDAFQVGEDAVTPLVMQTVNGVAEELIVIHRKIRTRQDLTREDLATPWHGSF